MGRGGAIAAGVGLGAGLSYFFDPGRGARRRARIRDLCAHSAAVARRGLSATGRDAWHRTYGTAASLRSRMRHADADDCVVVERVRAKLGRLASHPHAIGVMASAGDVRLRGLVLEHEAEPLLRAVHRIPGVHEVIDQLERHREPKHIPALQGGRAPHGNHADVMQSRWAPATRAAMAAGGAALILLGTRRRGRLGLAGALGGASLLTRAGANHPIDRLLGIGATPRGLDVQKTITIAAPAAAVASFWSRYENFPRFMSRVLDITPSGERPAQSRWKVAGPAGIPVEFDAEIVRHVPNQLVAWKTLPGAAVAHAGSVRFDEESPGKTRVHIRMSYSPPAGWVGHTLATAFGVDPKHSMDADLARMKTLIETGHSPHDAARHA